MNTVVIVSGYFNPIHLGHIRLLQEAKKLGDKLIVIVNNDIQQMTKYRSIVMDEKERLEVVKAIGVVDNVVLSIDVDPSVIKTIAMIISNTALHEISNAFAFISEFIFANGGDRKNEQDIPESFLCKVSNIKMVFNVGGEKINSSSKINERCFYA